MKWTKTTATLMAGFAVLAAGASSTSAKASARPSATTVAEPRVPRLSWTSCHDGFQCTSARVPLHYRHPAGATISIAVIRHLATDRAHRAGTLFVNGGGPTAQIAPFAAGGYAAIPAALRARFDIMTFDPRGFGSSMTPARMWPVT
jgi:hypothetical protein